MQIEAIEIAKLISDPSNARKHGQKNLDSIVGSLSKFGQQKPIVIDKNNVVVAGNGTLDAAKKIGWKKINCVRTELSGPEAIAFALADNRTAELAEWDIEPLNKTLQALKDMDFDLGAIGFDTDFMDAHTPEVVAEGLTDPDAVPENVETRCKPGDLWILGEHRLLCGNSTNVQLVEMLMDGVKNCVLITDPPYGVNLGEHNASNEKRDGLQVRKGYRSVSDSKEAFFENVVPTIKYLIEVTGRGAVFGFCPNIWEYPAPDVLGGIFVPAATGRNKWGWSNFMPVLLYGSAPNSHLGAKPTVLNSNARGDKVDHPTSKPVEWMVWLIELCSKDSDNVIEPFCGSGSTLIACEKTGRKCYGMEIDPHYCDVILKRWEDFTGKVAVLDSLPSEKGSVNG